MTHGEKCKPGGHRKNDPPSASPILNDGIDQKEKRKNTSKDKAAAEVQAFIM
jgi:hypothetical protein